MSIKDLFFGADRPAPAARAAIARWRALPEADLRVPMTQARLALLDLDVTGVDLGRDRVTGIALARVDAATLRPDSLRYLALPDPAAAPAEAPESVLDEFLEALGSAALVTYHAGFVDAMLGRALPGYADAVAPRLVRIDLAHLLARYFGAEGPAPVPLAHWLRRFDIAEIRQHDALCDAYAIAQLLLVTMARAEALGVQSLAQLASAAADSARRPA